MVGWHATEVKQPKLVKRHLQCPNSCQNLPLGPNAGLHQLKQERRSVKSRNGADFAHAPQS